MLSIGEFSKICKVSTKTLRYYAEIGLILPSEVNPENGYRYYAVEQLETMLFINHLKSYHFSLEEIKAILEYEDVKEDKLYSALIKKKREIKSQINEYKNKLNQIEKDIQNLTDGKSIMSYLDAIDVQVVEVPVMRLLFIRKFVQQCDYPKEYQSCFGEIMRRIQAENLTITAPPMVLFHDDEFTPFGLDTEFAIPIQECITSTREFKPGLCLKTVVQGSYDNLPSVYAKQIQWAETKGYECSSALYEVYVNDISQTQDESELITEVYYPIKKR